jgi:hypothetical protein
VDDLPVQAVHVDTERTLTVTLSESQVTDIVRAWAIAHVPMIAAAEAQGSNVSVEASSDTDVFGERIFTGYTVQTSTASSEEVEL